MRIRIQVMFGLKIFSAHILLLRRRQMDNLCLALIWDLKFLISLAETLTFWQLYCFACGIIICCLIFCIVFLFAFRIINTGTKSSWKGSLLSMFCGLIPFCHLKREIQLVSCYLIFLLYTCRCWYVMLLLLHRKN